MATTRRIQTDYVREALDICIDLADGWESDGDPRMFTMEKHIMMIRELQDILQDAFETKIVRLIYSLRKARNNAIERIKYDFFRVYKTTEEQLRGILGVPFEEFIRSPRHYKYFVTEGETVYFEDVIQGPTHNG
uniref:Prophage protein n=1 Tax=Strongyloides papillosus TaxID=174720 RepID=A0A0N5BER6_STREA